MVPQPPTAAVTPRGVREGDPPTLAALAERRGGAVLAYGEQVCAPGEALAAAADALARFRRSVAEADDPLTLDPEQALLRATRYAAAARAPHPAQAPRRLGRRGGPCALVPELLAARASGDLTEGDSSRLARHLERCAACREAEERFNGGEFAYLAAPDVAPEQPVTAELMRALITAVPRHTNGNGNGAVNGATAAESFVVATAATDSAAADAAGDATTPAESAAAPAPSVAPEPTTLSWDAKEVEAAVAAASAGNVVTRAVVPGVVLGSALAVAIVGGGAFARDDSIAPLVGPAAALPIPGLHPPRPPVITPLPERAPAPAPRPRAVTVSAPEPSRPAVVTATRRAPAPAKPPAKPARRRAAPRKPTATSAPPADGVAGADQSGFQPSTP